MVRRRVVAYDIYTDKWYIERTLTTICVYYAVGRRIAEGTKEQRHARKDCPTADDMFRVQRSAVPARG